MILQGLHFMKNDIEMKEESILYIEKSFNIYFVFGKNNGVDSGTLVLLLWRYKN